MKLRVIAILVCGGVALGAGWLAWRAASGRETAERALAALVAGKAELSVSITKTETTASELEEKRRGLEAESIGAHVATGGAASGGPMAKRARSPDEIVASEPALQTLSFRFQMALMRREYFAFYHLARLSPEQVAKFEAALARHIEVTHDLGVIGRAQDAEGKQMIANLRAAAKSEYEAAMAEALGPEGHRQWREYLRTRTAHAGVTQALAGVVAMAGVPLSEEQVNAMRQMTLVAAKDDGTLKSVDLRLAIDWDVFDTEAKKILTPEQFHLLTTRTSPEGFHSRWEDKLGAVIRKATNSGQGK